MHQFSPGLKDVRIQLSIDTTIGAVLPVNVHSAQPILVEEDIPLCRLAVHQSVWIKGAQHGLRDEGVLILGIAPFAIAIGNEFGAQETQMLLWHVHGYIVIPSERWLAEINRMDEGILQWSVEQ